MKLDAEFIRLPLAFDVERLVREVDQFAESSWMPHPDGRKGNSAIPLISQNAGDNNAFRGRMLPTPHLARCPYIQQVIASFGEQVFGRSRLMRLDGGCEVVQHNDANYHWYNRVRIHIPVITYPEVVFYCADRHVHMAAGECWIFDSWQKHNVVNGTDRTRVHLVLDTSGSAKFWDMVGKSARPCSPGRGASIETRFVPHEPGKQVRILTERYNATPVLAPGELDGLVGDLIRDVSAEPANPPEAVAEYVRILRSFSKDWRRLWSLHGYEESGTERYKALMMASARELKALAGELFTSSNRLPARDVFFYLVYDAALSPDVPGFYDETRAGQDRGQGAGADAASDAPPSPEVGRNDPCPCGSGRRYKHCHGRLDATVG